MDWGTTDAEHVLSEEDAWKVQTRVRRNNEYTLQESQVRNVMVVGRQRTGKSTAVGVLKDPVYESEPMSLFSNPAPPKYASFALDNKETGVKYSLSLIDTPGLMDVVEEGKEARSDENLLEAITYCIKNEITRINLLMVVVSFEVGIAQDDITAIGKLQEKFCHGDLKTIILVTRSENKSKEWKERIKSQLNQHAFFRSLIESGNVKVLFSGCVDQETLKNVYEKSDLIRKYKAVYAMRKEVLQAIFDASTPVSLMELPFATTQAQEARVILEAQHGLLEELQEVKDWDNMVSGDHLKVAKFAENLTQLEKKEATIMFTSDLLQSFKQLCVGVKSIIGQVPPKMRPLLVGSLPIVY